MIAEALYCHLLQANCVILYMNICKFFLVIWRRLYDRLFNCVLNTIEVSVQCYLFRFRLEDKHFSSISSLCLGLCTSGQLDEWRFALLYGLLKLSVKGHKKLIRCKLCCSIVWLYCLELAPVVVTNHSSQIFFWFVMVRF